MWGNVATHDQGERDHGDGVAHYGEGGASGKGAEGLPGKRVSRGKVEKNIGNQAAQRKNKGGGQRGRAKRKEGSGRKRGQGGDASHRGRVQGGGGESAATEPCTIRKGRTGKRSNGGGGRWSTWGRRGKTPMRKIDRLGSCQNWGERRFKGKEGMWGGWCGSWEQSCSHHILTLGGWRIFSGSDTISINSHC